MEPFLTCALSSLLARVTPTHSPPLHNHIPIPCLPACLLCQIAIEGCCHGELDNIYATLEYMQKAKGQKIDLLICCGDFQVLTVASNDRLTLTMGTGGGGGGMTHEGAGWFGLQHKDSNS